MEWKHLLHRLKNSFPCHEMALTMSISFDLSQRLIQETDKIIKAQIARGVDFLVDL